MPNTAINTKHKTSNKEKSEIKVKPKNSTLQPYHYTAKNGAAIILSPIEVGEMVSVFLRIKTGSIFEGQFLGSGISHLLEHSVFLGSKGFVKKDSFSAYIEKLGGIDLNAYTTYDHTAYYFSVFAKNLKPALNALVKFIFFPLLKEDDISNEMGTVVSEMHMISDRPSSVFYDFITSNLYNKLPYKYPIIGLKNKFSALSPGKLKTYYESTYRSENMVLSLAGNLNIKKTTKLVNETFGIAKNANTKKPTLVQPKKAWQKQKEDATIKCCETTHAKVVFPKIALLYPTTHIENACSVHLDLFSFFLTSGRGSFLFDEIKEDKQLVQDISSYSFTPKAFAPEIAAAPAEKGYFSINFELGSKYKTPTQVKNQTEKVRKHINKIINQILINKNLYAKNLPNLLEAAKNNLIKDFLEEKESPMEVASSLTYSLHIFNSLNFESMYLSLVRKATIPNILSTIKKYFISVQPHSFLLLPKSIYDAGHVYKNSLREKTNNSGQKKAAANKE